MRSAPSFPGSPSEQEKSRLQELYRYQILHTGPDPVFDDLARLAAQICGTPMAVISFMDSDRQWFKSKLGVEVDEYPRHHTFCAQVICEDDLFIVPDPARDERFVDSPAVIGDEQARFYAGAPLRVPTGHVLGALSVLDRRPRTLNAGQREGLRALARQIVAQLELRRSVAELERKIVEQREAEQAQCKLERRFSDFMNNGPAVAYIKDEYGRFVYANVPLSRLFGMAIPEILGKTDADFFGAATAQSIQEHDLSVFNEGKTLIVEEMVPNADGTTEYWQSYKFLLQDDSGNKKLGGMSFNITARKRAEQERERLVGELQEALTQVKTLKGFIPICASCKNIRDDEGYWQQIESYLCEHSELEFTHGICPACLEKFYPEFVAQSGTKLEPMRE